MSVYVVRAFVELRELLASNAELARRLDGSGLAGRRIIVWTVTRDPARAALGPRRFFIARG
jgi:hypothetical protein